MQQSCQSTVSWGSVKAHDGQEINESLTATRNRYTYRSFARIASGRRNWTGFKSRARTQSPMDLVFTDLDGSLLDAQTYSWHAARPAIECLDKRGTPWILVTSKTRAEVEFWREKLGHRHPFI